MKKANTLRIGGAVIALAAVSAVGAGGAATASTNERLAVATINIKGQGQNLRFQGDDEVVEGDQLQINNRTDPNADGPHTFSLVTKQALPQRGEERRKCGKLPPKLKVCERIFDAHDPLGTPIYTVENGNPGWDLPFDKNTDGDSWFTETEDDTTSREVSNLTNPFVGKLRYFCIVHPFMKGKIKVIED